MATSTYKLTPWQQACYYAAFAAVYALSLLPLRVLYCLSDATYMLVYHLVRYRRRLVERHLRESFPEKSPAELRRTARAFYHWLCDFIFENIKLFSASPEEMRRRMRFTNPGLLERYMKAGRGVILYLGHHANWEWVSTISLHMPPRFHASQVYHVLENHVIDKLMLYPRSRMGNDNVAMHEVLRYIVANRNAGRTVGIGLIADQAPFWNNIGHWLTFLNHEQTPVLTGPEKLARRFDMVCLYLDMRRLRRGYYEAELHVVTDTPTADPPLQQTERYYQMLENTIRRDPACYLWTHKRWKRTREQYDSMIDPATGKLKF